MKKRLIILVFLMLGLCLFSCSDNTGNDETVRVMLTFDNGVRVLSDNPLDVPVGDDAEFEIEFKSGYVLDRLSGGKIDDSRVIVENAERRTIVTLTTTSLGYDTSVKYRYYFRGEVSDTSTLKNSASANAGTLVTVSANEKYKTFVGWSLNGYSSDEADMISRDRLFTFRLSPELANKDGVVRIFANYKEADTYYYNPNGGQINQETGNTAENDYYIATNADGRLCVRLTERYTGIFESVSLFYDDATFTRAGYVLREYNTKPDGTGTSYSLGSKYYAGEGGEGNELYCIWEPVSEGFSYEPISLPNPTTEARAPHWRSSGVTITGYSGDAEKVVIPEIIDGEYVIGISSGAFENKSLRTLVLSKYIEKIEDGAFIGCSSLHEIYYPDSIYYISNDALDSASYSSLKRLYVNATMAPRFASSGDGAFSVKLSRLLASPLDNRIVVIAGSSTYQGLSSAYMEALLENSRRVVNFGTTRTTNGLIYLEAMQALAHEGDIVLYAPENSTYMMGETELYWKTLRDIECMNNFYRYIDISHYTNVFSAFADFNQNYRYVKNPVRYEDSVKPIETGRLNLYGEYTAKSKDTPYVDAYYITMNDKYKTKYEGSWSDVGNQEANKDYNDPNNITWDSILEPKYKDEVNRALAHARSSGASVYFSFCPVDADKLFDEAKNGQWLLDYDNMIRDEFDFDGVLGKSSDYIFAHEYFYDCAFHLNDVGRTLRTYRMYLDLSALFGITPRAFTSVGTSFSGCIFEEGNSSGIPNNIPEYLK